MLKFARLDFSVERQPIGRGQEWEAPSAADGDVVYGCCGRSFGFADVPSRHLLLLVRFALTFPDWQLEFSGVHCLGKAAPATRCGELGS